MGGIAAAYQNSLEWTYQATSSPQNHIFFLENLTYCGISLLANYSNNWPVVLDTASVCLSLPKELYNIFTTWLDNATVVDYPSRVSQLPSLTFQLPIDSTTNSGETYFISLGDLLINASDFLYEIGHPAVRVKNAPGGVAQMRLCVLQGSAIVGSSSQFNTPYIILGSLAMQSLYIAADYNNGGVGLAAKPRGASTGGSSVNAGCAVKADCEGEQYYS